MEKIENCSESLIHDWVKLHLRLILIFTSLAVSVGLYKNVLLDVKKTNNK